MGRLTGPPISEKDKKWMEQQRVFFVASAPLEPSYHVNVSPKSGREFRVIDENTICWLDLSGSGSETAAHILENGRVTVMFVALTGDPKILRLYGTGRLILPLDMHKRDNAKVASLFKGELLGDENCDPGFRSVTILNVHRMTHSCGYSIPLFDYVKDRLTLKEFAEQKGHDGMEVYRGFKNSFSIDGMSSIGQLLMKQVPCSVEHKGGYYFASYEKSGIFKQLYVYYFIATHSIRAKHLARDFIMVCLGALLCLSYMTATGQLAALTQ